MAKTGYYGGDPGAVLAARVDHVMAAMEYEKFLADYEAIEYELNREDKK